MFLNSWAIALILVSILSCFLIIMAGKTAVRVLRHWNLESDSNTQIELEGEIWLSSTLVLYGACFQIISLLMLVFAADHFAGFIKGAMCATGSFLANSYGLPVLYIKLATSFYAGLWIVVHKLDISCEAYPLVRFKYIMLLFLVPMVLTDLYLQIQYIGHLSPDIITSCCAIIFDAGQAPVGFHSLFHTSLGLFYSCSFGLLGLGCICRLSQVRLLTYLYGVLVCGWLLLAIDALITRLSSYIYAMPYHNCPFCIVKSEYNFIGVCIYLLLFGSVFYGFNAGFVQLFSRVNGLRRTVEKTCQKYLSLSLMLLTLFMLVSSYHFVVYRFLGGE